MCVSGLISCIYIFMFTFGVLRNELSPFGWSKITLRNKVKFRV